MAEISILIIQGSKPGVTGATIFDPVRVIEEHPSAQETALDKILFVSRLLSPKTAALR